MATTRLALYNGALLLIGEESLATLTENNARRRALDEAWDAGAIRFCLEQGAWNFATRSRKAEYSPSVEPPFGYRRAFDKPEDWVRTVSLSADEYFTAPLTRVADEAGFWFADLDAFFIRYVSDDAQFGMDLSKWPETFTRYVEAYLAHRVALRLSKGETIEDRAEKKMKAALSDARFKDAANTAQGFPAPGSWADARMGGSYPRSWRR